MTYAACAGHGDSTVVRAIGNPAEEDAVNVPIRKKFSGGLV
jgi:hypothetical protein